MPQCRDLWAIIQYFSVEIQYNSHECFEKIMNAIKTIQQEYVFLLYIYFDASHEETYGFFPTRNSEMLEFRQGRRLAERTISLV